MSPSPESRRVYRLVKAQFPGLATFAGYERAWLRPDLIAGLTVTAYLVPQVMAYAQLAGLDPVAGLWAVLLPAVAYAVLASSRLVSIGPESTTAIMVAAAVGPLAGGDPVRYAALAAAAAVLVGAICLAGGVLRLGFLGDLLSHPILVGYMTGVAILMVVSQLGRLTGIPIDAETVGGRIVQVLGNLTAIHAPTLVVGVGVIVFLVAMAPMGRRVPAPLLAVIGAAAFTIVAGLDSIGVEVVGDIPSGLPPLRVPPVGPSDVAGLIGASLGIAVVGYSDVLLTARSFATRHGPPVDANAELLALGGANLAAGLTASMPVSSSASRTAIAAGAGGRTQVVGLFAAACVLIVLLAAGGLLARFPTAALGGLVVVAGLRLIDVVALRRLARFRPSELGLALAAAAGVVLVDVLAGILIAIALSVLELFARVARPPAAVLGRPPGVAGLHDITEYPDAVTIPGLVVFRYDAPLCFANANDFVTRALDAVERQAEPVEWLLLNAEAIVEVDLTAADALGALHDELSRRGIVLAMARVKHDLRNQLERIGLVTHIGPERLFPTLPVALEAFERRSGGPSDTEPIAGSESP